MSDTLAASVIRWSAMGADCANSMVKPTKAEVAPKLLAKQIFDIRFIVDHENERVHARSPDLTIDVPARGSIDPEFGELAGPCIDLYRPAMLLDDDVVTNGQAKSGPFTGRLCRKERVEQLLFHLGGIPVPLSRILISTLSPRFLVAAASVGS